MTQYIAMTSFTTEDKRYQRGNIYEASDFTDQNQIDEFISLNYIQVYQGGTGGTDNYQALNNKPMINGVVLNGNKSSSDLLIPTPINYQAGTGIDITGNVISATGGGGGETYTAGENITIDPNNEISAVDTKYTAGQNVTITSANVINAIIDLTDYYNKTEVNDLIATMSAIQMEIVDTLPTTGASNTIYLLDTGSNSYEQYVYTNSAWQKIGDTTVDLSNYVTIPMMQNKLLYKQDRLTAGDNVTISNNKISATDTKYYAGTNISINSGNVISANVQKYTGGSNVSITNTGVINAVDTKYQAGDGMKLTGTTFSALPYIGGDKVTVNNQRVISIDLTDYYNKTQINHLLENLDSVSMKVVLDLPVVGVKNIIYLVRMGEENFYNQYIYSDNEWYNIGTTQIDLDNYYTIAQTDDLLDDKQDLITPNGAMLVVGDQSVFTSIDWDTNTAVEATGQDIYNYIDNKLEESDKWQKKLNDGTRVTTVTDSTNISNVDLINKEVSPMTAKTLFDYMWKKIYPVGSIYMSMDLTSPATLFGGTWEQIKDRFLLATGSTYNVVNATGGSKETTINRSDLPNVNITTSSNGYKSTSFSNVVKFDYTQGGSNNKFGMSYGRWEEYMNGDIGNKTTASNHTHNFDLNGNVTQTKLDNMPPYVTVNVWKRTA